MIFRLLFILSRLLQRRLFRTDKFNDNISVLFIEGKAFVVHTDSMKPKALDDWCTHDDHFHTHDQAKTNRPLSSTDFSTLRATSFKKCKACFNARVAQLEEEHERMESHEPLRGLELFAGAGGLSTGFDQSGFVKTKWAVEMGASACLTYRYVPFWPNMIVANTMIPERTILMPKYTMLLSTRCFNMPSNHSRAGGLGPCIRYLGKRSNLCPSLERWTLSMEVGYVWSFQVLH